jgi:hypothetical protein
MLQEAIHRRGRLVACASAGGRFVLNAQNLTAHLAQVLKTEVGNGTLLTAGGGALRSQLAARLTRTRGGGCRNRSDIQWSLWVAQSPFLNDRRKQRLVLLMRSDFFKLGCLTQDCGICRLSSRAFPDLRPVCEIWAREA